MQDKAKRVEIKQQVEEFLVEQCGVDSKRFGEQTRLEHDLGITGDDADEIMRAFMDRFGVDMSLFEFNRYFGPEVGCNPAVWLWCRLFTPRLLQSKPITVEDLIEAAMQKKWVPK